MDIKYMFNNIQRYLKKHNCEKSYSSGLNIFLENYILFEKSLTEAKLLVLLHSYQEDMLFGKWNVR